MTTKKPTLAQQTYEKVCAIETILNSLLALCIKHNTNIWR